MNIDESMKMNIEWHYTVSKYIMPFKNKRFTITKIFSK